MNNTSESRVSRLARISVLIVVIFIFCHSLKILPSLLEILGYPPELIPGVLPVSHLLLTINCSVNFLVYYLGEQIYFPFNPCKSHLMYVHTITYSFIMHQLNEIIFTLF